MSEELKPEYKIFEDINLENNKIINISEISSYDGDEADKYNSAVKNSGLYIHTPKYPTTFVDETDSDSNEILPIKDGGLIVTTGHAQTFLDKIDNTSNEINNVVNTYLNISSMTKTDLMSPVIDIKSANSPTNTEILIRDDKSSDAVEDNGITITTDRTKIISTKSGNKTSEKNSNAVILEFSDSVSSHIDLHRADIYQANTQIFVAGTTYGYPGNNDDIIDGEANNTDNGAKGNALYVDTENVNIYVPTKIISDTSITGKLTQSGNVEINKGVYGESHPSTTIDGSSLNVNTRVVNIGNNKTKTKDIDSIDVKTKEINIGTASTDSTSRNTLKIGSTYSDLTVTGRDFLIDSDTTKTSNTSVDALSNNTAKSYLRSYYINSNDSYIHDLLTIGPNNTSSHLQLNGYADITGNLDVDGDIDVKNTIYLHNSRSEDLTTSYVKSNGNNGSLQINNDTEVIISNAPKDGEDSNQISIKDDLIKTSKKLDLDANQNINGTLTFDGSNDIKDLNYIKTDTLEVSNNSTDVDKNLVLTIKTLSNNEEFSVDSNLIKLKNNDLTNIDDTTSGTVNEGKFKQTGNVYINTSENYNTLIRGNSISLESSTVNIGSEDSSKTQEIYIGTKKSDNTITIGTGTGDTDSNIVLKGKDLELTSTAKSTSKTVSYLRVSDINTDTVKVNNSIIIGEESETNNFFKLYGNADISNNLDVHNTIYLHSDNAEDDSLKSYIQSKDTDGELVINNDTLVTISNGKSDSNKISITPDEIDTRKKLDLNANQEIEGTLTFDGSDLDKKILDLKTIETSSLSIETKGTPTNDLNITYNSSNKSITVKSDELNITSTNTINGDSNIDGDLTQTGDATITGIVKINDGNDVNTTDIDGANVYINPVHTEIGIEERSTDIALGHQSSDVTISGANRLEIKSKSSESESKITVDKVSISNSTDDNKVNIYWDPSSSTLIFEKG